MGAIGSILTPSKATENAEKLVAFSAGEFRAFKIKSIRDLSPNTKLFVVDLQSPQHRTVWFSLAHEFIHCS
jgi:hypothetical protein